MENPKIFISYSWTTPEHEQRVLDIATELVESGIDVILDKWNLKEGDDADVFMEQMIADPTIQKVLIICDKMYSEKSDKRKGGAGTEAQIISREVYEQQPDENKFVVAAFEINEETCKPYLPVYYGSRKYIDFTDPNKYARKFEELVRWVYNKPLYVKPKLGRVPDYILADDKKTLGTTAAYRRAISLVAEGRTNAVGAVREYLNTFAENLQSFQLPSCRNHSDYYALFTNSIKDFVPYRDEWIELLKNVCRNDIIESTFDSYMRFFEYIHLYTQERRGVTYVYQEEEDNMKFIEYELMLCFIAVLLRNECFVAVADLFNTSFYNKKASNEYEATYTYREFEHHLYSVYNENQYATQRYYSLLAKILYDRMESCSALSIEDICQADFVTWLHFLSNKQEENWRSRWFPHSILYSCNQRRPFEIFARAESCKYLDKIKVIFGYDGLEDFKMLYDYIEKNSQSIVPRWQFESPDVKLLMNVDKLGIRK